MYNLHDFSLVLDRMIEQSSEGKYEINSFRFGSDRMGEGRERERERIFSAQHRR